MKKIVLFISLGLITLISCKKDDNPAIPAKQPDPPKKIIYSYSVNLLCDKENSNSVGDTLIVKINDFIVTISTGNSIPNARSFMAHTGDRVFIHYNPGIVQYGSDWIIAQNKLALDFNATTGGFYEIQFDNCRCVGNYNNVVR